MKIVECYVAYVCPGPLPCGGQPEPAVSGRVGPRRSSVRAGPRLAVQGLALGWEPSADLL